MHKHICVLWSVGGTDNWKHQKSNDEIQICKNAMSISDIIEHCTWAVYFFVCRSKDEHKMVGFAYCRCSNFHFSLNTSRIYSSCVLCVNPLCRSAHFHISILIYGKCYSVVCLTTGTKVHLYLLQKLHNPHTTQGDVHIFRNFYIWFVFFFFTYSVFFSFLFFAHYPFQHRFIRLRCFSKCMLLGHLKKTRLLKLEGSGGKIFRTIFRCENGQRQLLVANFSTKKSATRWITLILLFCLFILWRRYNPLV